MFNAGEVWGGCPYKWLTYDSSKLGVIAFYYKCEKTNNPCDPRYCLGPDEDREEKQHEQETD